jgi:hypothetical protein
MFKQPNEILNLLAALLIITAGMVVVAFVMVELAQVWFGG